MTEEHLARCQAIKDEFAFHGASIAEWARRHGFAVQVVYDVLGGRCACKRGAAHRVAVALRIKDGSLNEAAL